MLENTWYSVISPENCSTILWGSWDYKETAADALKLTANNMLENGLIDGIIKEPLGGAHSDPEKMVKLLKSHLRKEIADLMEMDPEERIIVRIDKYSKMGEFELVSNIVEQE